MIIETDHKGFRIEVNAEQFSRIRAAITQAARAPTAVKTGG